MNRSRLPQGSERVTRFALNFSFQMSALFRRPLAVFLQSFRKAGGLDRSIFLLWIRRREGIGRRSSGLGRRVASRPVAGRVIHLDSDYEGIVQVRLAMDNPGA